MYWHRTQICSVTGQNHLPASRDRCCSYCPALWRIFYDRTISYKFYRLIMIMFTVLLFTGAKTICVCVCGVGWGGGCVGGMLKKKKKNIGRFLGRRPALLLRDCHKFLSSHWVSFRRACCYFTCLFDTPFLQKKQKTHKLQIRPTTSTKCKPWNRCKFWA